MDCLNCATTLSSVTREGVDIEQCPACSGIWLDAHELTRLVNTESTPTDAAERSAAVERKHTPALAPSETETGRNCPTCSQPLERVNYDEGSGIMVDSCPEHGVWLDSGELERIETWIEGWDEELAAPEPSAEDTARRARLDTASDGAASSPLGWIAAGFRSRGYDRSR